MVRKLILTRDDTADRVIEALTTTKDTALTVVAPRGSSLADREGLARIGEQAAERGIVVAIESVDEELLSLAHAAHLETVHPFFKADRRHLSLDGIVKKEKGHAVTVAPQEVLPTQEDEVVYDEPEAPVIKHHDGVVRITMDEAEPVAEEEEEQEPIEPHRHHAPAQARPSQEARPTEDVYVARDKEVTRRGGVSWFRVGVAGLVILGLIGAGGEFFMRGGTVTVTLAETPWEYTGTVIAATSVTTSSAGTLAIPGQLFESQKNVAQAFAATGEPGAADTPAAEQPQVTVYNESLEPETFVVKTRFQGKSGLFRAATAVAIPAATKEGDKLVPGKATVGVVPDSASVLSDATEGERLSVPGLAGSSKETLFYAILAKPKEQTAENTGSQTAPADRVVTTADETKAKEQIIQVLTNSFKASLIASQPEGLTLIEGAIQVEPKQLTVNKEVDASGNFNLVGQATLRGLAFREEDLKTLLLREATSEEGIGYEAVWKDIDIQYTEVKPELGSGKLTFVVKVTGTMTGQVTEEAIRSEVAGKARSQVAAWIQGKEEFAEGSVSISPFWRFSLPTDPAAISLEIK